MPSRSSSFTRLASENRGGGSVKCCDGVISRTSTWSPWASGGIGGRSSIVFPSSFSRPSI